MLRPNRSMHRIRFGTIVAAAVPMAAFFLAAFLSANDVFARDGACKYDVTQVPVKSECLRSVLCGAAGGSITVSGATYHTSTDGSILCCMTELVEPAHTTITAGDKRIVHVTDVTGTLITRRCSSPIVLFWISFGSWTCEVDSLTPFGTYSIDRAEVCE